jgi:uncharacterized SAM-binding protein YcdF (DUF218 family)
LRRFASGLALAILTILLLLALNYRTVLHSIGEFLVDEQAPVKSDVALVLAGDSRGRRILRAGELVRQGMAPVALISGPMEVYGVNEATLAIQFAQSRGFPPGYFHALPIRALSTLDEARAIGPELRRRSVRSVLLVTSNFHTRRAAEIFRRVVGNDIRFITIAAGDEYFGPDSWWHNREGQKTVFYELSKTLAGWVGL